MSRAPCDPEATLIAKPATACGLHCIWQPAWCNLLPRTDPPHLLSFFSSCCLLPQVMVEQYKNGSTFDRAIAKVVTLASPSYKAPDVELPGMYLSSQPMVGVSWSARGAVLMLLDIEQGLLRLVEALSEEALLGIISSTGMAALLLHNNPHSGKVGCSIAAGM